jgi:hypothetical protein
MKRKEIKNLAKKIAQAEFIIQHSDDPKEVSRAQDQIIEYSGHAMSLEDMSEIDGYAQEILEELEKNS